MIKKIVLVLVLMSLALSVYVFADVGFGGGDMPGAEGEGPGPMPELPDDFTSKAQIGVAVYCWHAVRGGGALYPYQNISTYYDGTWPEGAEITFKGHKINKHFMDPMDWGDNDPIIAKIPVDKNNPKHDKRMIAYEGFSSQLGEGFCKLVMIMEHEFHDMTQTYVPSYIYQQGTENFGNINAFYTVGHAREFSYVEDAVLGGQGGTGPFAPPTGGALDTGGDTGGGDTGGEPPPTEGEAEAEAEAEGET